MVVSAKRKAQNIGLSGYSSAHLMSHGRDCQASQISNTECHRRLHICYPSERKRDAALDLPNILVTIAIAESFSTLFLYHRNGAMGLHKQFPPGNPIPPSHFTPCRIYNHRHPSKISRRKLRRAPFHAAHRTLHFLI